MVCVLGSLLVISAELSEALKANLCNFNALCTLVHCHDDNVVCKLLVGSLVYTTKTGTFPSPLLLLIVLQGGMMSL